MKKLIASIAAFVAMLALAACTAATLEINYDDTGVHAVATGRASGSGTGTLSIGEDESIVINHTVDNGSFHVSIVGEDGEAVFDEDITDNIFDQVVASGDFTVTISADKATGTVDVIPGDPAALAAADETLDDALLQATGKTAEELGLGSEGDQS